METISIIGVPGAGKTTLGNKLSKFEKFVVIDTDDIYDKIAYEIVMDEKYKYMTEDKNINLFYSITDSIFMTKLTNKINNVKKNKKIAIIISGTIPTDIENNYRYYLDTDPDTVYRRFVSRTIIDTCENKKEIKKIINDKLLNDNQKHIILTRKYRIRGPINISVESIEKNIKHVKERSKLMGYKSLNSDQIYNRISKLAKK